MQAAHRTLNPHLVRSITRLGLLLTFSLLCVSTLTVLLVITVRDLDQTGPNMSYALNVITIYAAFLRTLRGSNKNSGDYLLTGTPNNSPPPSPPHYGQNLDQV